jgi:hypothetical protein
MRFGLITLLGITAFAQTPAGSTGEAASAISTFGSSAVIEVRVCNTLMWDG